MQAHDGHSTAGRIQSLIAEQASEWLIRLEDENSSSEDRSAFTDWLTASPAHVSEFLHARATWETLMGRAFDRVADDETLLRELSTTGGPDIVALDSQRPAQATRRYMAIAASIAGAAFLAGAILWSSRALDPDRAIYSTAIGEQTSFTLPDGSTLALNTHSRVQLEWSEQFRDIHLDRGEALFQVAHDPSRPFRVWAGGTPIRAVGTRFNVYRTDARVTVTVLEGRVAVEETLLDAGDQVRIEPQVPLQPKRLTTLDSVVAWQSRRLIFDGEPLAQVIEEFNRYNAIPLVIDDATLNARRIHGIFDATDRASLITFLQETDHVRVEKRDGEMVILRQ